MSVLFLFEILGSFFILFGSFFVLFGAIGLVRFPDFYTRLHAPTKASTLGVGSIVLGSIFLFYSYNNSINLYELLVIFFLFISAPISAHMLAKSAIKKKLSSIKKTKNNENIF